MSLETIIATAIQDEAKKLTERHHNYHNWLNQEISRKNRRVTHVPPKQIKTPEQWNSSPLFNPFYVHKRSESIARLISKKILSREYKPHPSFETKIPKATGGHRIVNIFEIPDAAISRLFFQYLMKKNRHRFSSFTYAYRNDKNSHFAIQDIYNNIENNHRLFIAEYDFSNFFDSIGHDFLINELQNNKFFVSDTEKFIIKTFLDSTNNTKGIPQGTSISLFLANVACFQLDKNLEREGLNFARYADDTIIWAKSYEKICTASNILFEFSNKAQIAINFEKSGGISLLVPEIREPQEMHRIKESFDYLGYSISTEKVGIKAASIDKIKKHISYIIYSNLLQPIQRENIANRPFNKFYDRDALVCIQQIRRYLYGNISEDLIKKFMFGGVVSLNFKGVMSYYPLVTDIRQVKELDGWLAHSLMRALKKRYALASTSARINFSYVTVQKFLNDYATQNGGMFKIPSFMTIHKAIRRGLNTTGLNFDDSYVY